MKSLLKFAVVLLLLFAMVGMASADAGTVSASAAVNTSNTATYDVTVSWTGSINDTSVTPSIQIYDSASSPIGSSATPSGSGHSFEGVSLTAGSSYTVRVTDDEGTAESDSFTAPSAPVSLPDPIIDQLTSTSNSNDTHFELTWTTWTPVGSATNLEIYNGTGWEDVTSATTAFVAGNPASNTDIKFRTTDGTTNYSNETTIKTIPAVGISSTNATSSISWTLTNWENYTYTVEDDSGTAVAPGDLSLSGGGVLVASNLSSSENYTLKVRGVNGTPGNYYSLYNTNTAKTEATVTNFVSDIETSTNTSIFNTDNETVNFSIENGVTFRLNMTVTDPVTFTWKLEFNHTDDGWTTVSGHSNNTSTDNLENNFSWKPNTTGEYRLNLTMNTTTATPSQSQNLTWNITVTEKSTGSRIWQEGMPTDYTWDARSFSGFYYDLDTGLGSESMTIKGIGRSIDKGNLTYVTTTSSTEYNYSNWGSYDIVGFMGDKYFAGDNNSSLMKNGNLSKVLMDADDTEQLRSGQYYALEEGYSITVDQIDVNGGKALIAFYKDGKLVNSSITNEGQDAVFYKNIGSGSGNNTTIIKTRVKSVFMGTESSIVEIEGIFQISENMTKLESGTTINKMEITSVTNDRIEMENDERISLSQDSTVDLMGKVKFEVADSSTLRFAPIIEYTDPGVYEIRGTVSDYDNSDYVIYEWTPANFEGFYYNIDDDVESAEKIVINQDLGNSSRSIDKGNLEYSSKVTEVEYNYSNWGNYTVVGFMGEKYFTGIDGNLLKSGNLSKVLVDSDDSRLMNVGAELVLEEGVTVKISQINTEGSSAYLEVYKDNKLLEGGVVRSGQDFEYKKDVGSTKNVVFVKIRVDSVFMGTESSLISIGGIFQASDNLTKLESDAKYGKMKVDSYSADGINLTNDDRISLSQDTDSEFMKVGNNSMYFKIGDNSTLRFAPVVEKEIGSSDPLEVKLSPQNVTVGETVKITVNDRGLTIEGVTVYVNGSKIGTTNSSGEINFTTNATGSYKVTAEKTGFVNGSATLNVAENLVNMTVRVSPETIYFGTAGTIKATDSLNGSSVGDAEVYISGESVGRTNSSGELNYTFNKTGNVTIDVVKEKYNNGTTSINVSQEVAFAYSNFALKPDSPSAKKAIKLTFDVTNNGIKDGSHDVSLILKDSSGNVVDQANSTVSANMGKSKSVSLSVKAPEEGTYTLTLVETDSNRTIDLPSSMATVPVGEAKFGSTILYIVLAFLAIIVIAVVGFVAYLFGVKGATKDNYQMVAQEVIDDIKSKFQRK